jgi:membrane fusion protein (multidrug efflux system)
MSKMLKIFSYSLIILIILVGFFIAYEHFITKKHVAVKPKITLVSTITAQQHAVPVTVTSVGSLTPTRQTYISPKEDGYIKNIYYQPGEKVNTGQVLIQLDDAQLKATVAGDKAQVSTTRGLYFRYRKASKSGLILAQNLEQAKANYEISVATLAQNKVQLAETQLKAPFTGYVSTRNISIGDFVKSGQQLTQLVDRQNLRVQYTIPEAYANQLKLGQKVEVSFSNPSSIEMATVNFIAPNINQDTGDIAVQALLPSITPMVTPGEFVNIKQTIGSRQLVTVPEQSVVGSLNGYSVFTVSKSKAQSINVQLGANNYGQISIVSGLKANTKIIVKGAQQLKDGQTVKVTQEDS